MEERLSKFACVGIPLFVATAIFFWSFGVKDIFLPVLSLDKGVWYRALVFALLVVFGDVVGTRLSDVPKHNVRQLLERAAVVFIAGLFLAVNAKALIEGIGLFIPKNGVWSFDNVVRSVLIYATGAVFVSFFYSLFIPGYFAKKIVKESYPDQIDEISRKYSFLRQIIKTWNGAKHRYLVVIPNYGYMNLLPFGWLTPDIGFGIVTCCINIYISFKSTCRATDEPFFARLTKLQFGFDKIKEVVMRRHDIQRNVHEQ